MEELLILDKKLRDRRYDVKGRQLTIPVFDVYRNLGIDFNNAEDYNKFSFDGLHFNDVGNRMLADKIIEFLSNL